MAPTPAQAWVRGCLPSLNTGNEAIHLILQLLALTLASGVAVAAPLKPGAPRPPASASKTPPELLRSMSPSGETLFHYAVDPHVHSSVSGDARGKVRDIRAAARRAGLDAVVITDHGSVRAQTASRRASLDEAGPRLIPGAEASVRGAHVGLWNLAALPTRRQRRGRADGLALLESVARSAPDSLAVLNHPAWHQIGAAYFHGRWFDPEGDGPRFDAAELWNGKAPLRTKTSAMLMRWEYLLSTGVRLPIVGASDAHRPSEVGRVHTVIMARSLEPAELVDAVRRGRTYLSDGPRMLFDLDGVGPGDTLLSPDGLSGRVVIRGHADSRRTLLVFQGRERVAEAEVGPGLFQWDADVSARQDTWLRAELRRPPKTPGGRRDLALITSPVYVDVAPYGDFWKGQPSSWRRRPASARIVRRRQPRG